MPESLFDFLIMSFVAYTFFRLILLEQRLFPKARDYRIEFLTNINGEIKKVVHMFLKGNQSLPLSIAIKDKFGNVAKVDGAPAWAVTDAALGSLSVSDDGMAATFTPTGVVGALKIQVSADADLGEGVKSILGEIDVEVLAGEAVSVKIAAGTPVDIP